MVCPCVIADFFDDRLVLEEKTCVYCDDLVEKFERDFMIASVQVCVHAGLKVQGLMISCTVICIVFIIQLGCLRFFGLSAE